MATIGSLAYVVTANTAGFAAGMRSAQSNVTGFRSAIDRAGQSSAGFVAKLTAMVTGAAAAAFSIGGIASALHRISDSVKQADTLGVTANELQRLEVAGRKFGVESEGTVHALRKLQSEIGEAVGGSKEAAAKFENLGLSIGRLSAEDPAQAFRDISEAIHKLPSGYEQAAAATKIFGKSGLELIGVLRQGKEGLDAIGDKAQRAGLVMSNIQSQQAREADRAVGDLTKTLAGMTAIIAVDLAPTIQAVVQDITDFVQWIENLDSGTKRTAFRAIAMGAAFTGTIVVMGKVVKNVTALVETFKKLAAAETITQALSGPRGWAVLAAGLTIAAGAVYEVDQLLDSVNEKKEKVIKTTGKLAAADADAAKKTTDAMDKMIKSIDKVHEKTTDWQAMGESLQKSLRTPAEMYRDTIGEINNLLEQGAIGMDTWARAAERANKTLEEAVSTKEKFDAQINVAAVTRNTTAGFSAERQSDNETKRLLALAEKADKDRKEGNLHLREIKAKIQPNSVKVASL